MRGRFLLLMTMVAASAVAAWGEGGRSSAPARGEVVWIAQPSSSAPNARERKYGQAVSDRLARWLAEVGISCRVVDEDALTRETAAARLVLLPYNPSPPSSVLTALRHRAARGEKLVVFYSGSEALASLLGMRLGPYTVAPPAGPWRAIRFVRDTPAHGPVRVRQDSANIRPVYPVASDARIVAYWEDQQGHLTDWPAWVISSRGAWMSHVLLESDPAGKKHMLLAVLGHLDPTIWRMAAVHAVGGPDGGETVKRWAETVAGIRRKTAVPLSLEQENRLRAVEQRHKEALALYARGRYAESWKAATDMQRLLMEVYAAAQSPRRGEFRGVWDHSGLGRYPGQWNRTCEMLALAGMTAVFPNVARPAGALYESQVTLVSPRVALYGDQAALCTTAARRYGLEAHAWKICWSMDGAEPERLHALRGQGRLQVTDRGAPRDWLCPTDPRNRAEELAAIRDLAARYDWTGVHLDFIRFPGPDGCFCEGCRARFQRDTGCRVRRWPEEVQTGRFTNEWVEWRCEQITRFVGDVRRELRRIKPGLRLSAAVFPGYPACRRSIGQDWGRWLRDGLVDFVCPMNYTADRASFRQMTVTQLGLPGAAGRVYPGIGVTANESRLDAVGVIEQIQETRTAGAAGFMLFDLNDTLEHEILPYLRLGTTRVR